MVRHKCGIQSWWCVRTPKKLPLQRYNRAKLGKSNRTSVMFRGQENTGYWCLEFLDEGWCRPLQAFPCRCVTVPKLVVLSLTMWMHSGPQNVNPRSPHSLERNVLKIEGDRLCVGPIPSSLRYFPYLQWYPCQLPWVIMLTRVGTYRHTFIRMDRGAGDQDVPFDVVPAGHATTL